MVLPYIFWPETEKTRWLISEAQRDVFYASIVCNLQLFGFSITHSFWEGSGQYQPLAIKTNSENFEEEFIKQHMAGSFKARFRIGTRHGACGALFSFLHELSHFQQDLEGRIFDERTILEAEAANQSISAAYRLRGAGFSHAWYGAMGSLNWRSTAQAYEKDRQRPVFQKSDKNQKSDISAAHTWYTIRERKNIAQGNSTAPGVLRNVPMGT